MSVVLLVLIGALAWPAHYQGHQLSIVLTFGAPYSGTSYGNITGASSGCGVQYVHSVSPRFDLTTGDAKIGQKVSSSNRSCHGNTTFSQANATTATGLLAMPFTASAGTHEIIAKWQVNWTFNASLWSMWSQYPSDECTSWGIWLAAYNLTTYTVYSSAGFFGTSDPQCLGGNSTYLDHGSGLFSVDVNTTLTSGLWYVDTTIYIVSGSFVQDPGRAGALEDIAMHGDHARLVSITVT